MKNRFRVKLPLIMEGDEDFTITFSLIKDQAIEFTSGLYFLSGDNGSGKTTFLNMLALLAGTIGKEAGDHSGRIEYNGERYNGKKFNPIRAAEIRERYFCIFPQKAFFLPVSSRDNYMILNGTDPEKAESFSSRENPDLLSGGQQQKILMDIVLDAEKPVWFLDEPLSNLDAERRHYFWKTLGQGIRKNPKTIFFIDHGMGRDIQTNRHFHYCNTLRVFTSAGRRHTDAPVEYTFIDIYENPSPELFVSRQIERIETERSSGGIGNPNGGQNLKRST